MPLWLVWPTSSWYHLLFTTNVCGITTQSSHHPYHDDYCLLYHHLCAPPQLPSLLGHGADLSPSHYLQVERWYHQCPWWQAPLAEPHQHMDVVQAACPSLEIQEKMDPRFSIEMAWMPVAAPRSPQLKTAYSCLNSNLKLLKPIHTSNGVHSPIHSLMPQIAHPHHDIKQLMISPLTHVPDDLHTPWPQASPQAVHTHLYWPMHISNDTLRAQAHLKLPTCMHLNSSPSSNCPLHWHMHLNQHVQILINC